MSEGIKLDVTPERVAAIHRLLHHALEAYEPDNMAENLLWSLVSKLRDRLALKVIKMSTDPRHAKKSVKLNAIEAMAFHAWYYHMQATLEQEFNYESGLATSILHQIDQQYA